MPAKGKIQRTLTAAVTLAMLAPTARATTFVGMTDHVLARAADAIVTGTVRRIETVAGADGAINTLVTVEVHGEYKGSVGRLLTLKQPGGRIAGRGLWIAGSPRFAVGERQLLFLSAHRDGTARTTALGMGQLRLVPHPRTGETMAERRLEEPVLGARPVRRVALARLLRTIRRAVAADAGRATAPLRAEPDELVAPGLERETVEAFTLMDDPPARWFEPDSSQPVVYGVDAGGDPALGPAASMAAIDAALAGWTNVTGATITLVRGGAVAPAPMQCDDISQIVFGDPYDEMPSPVGCSGILALGGYCFSSATTIVNGQTFYRITEGNITFNRGFGACSFWNTTNLAEVATHELGHTIGIGHSSEDDNAPPDLKDATMYYRAHFDGRGASVKADDIAAVRFIYPGPGGDPTVDDSDGDGRVDAEDNCPMIANTAQTDSDGDGLGDLCDPCPLVPGGECQPIFLSRLRVRLTGRQTRLVWRGAVDLPDGLPPAVARVLLVNSAGVVVDAAPGAALRRELSPARLRYRSDGALVTLHRTRDGSYRVRVVVRGAQLGTGAVPLISGSLQVGSSSFAGSLSCAWPPRRRLLCHD